MLLRYLLILLISTCAWLLTSCTHYLYAPNTHNVPLFQDKKEARITAAVSIGDEFVGKEVQAAYSITDHLAVMANGFWASGGTLAETDNVIGHYGEGGLGYYRPLTEDFTFEVYAGPGFGRVTDYQDGGVASFAVTKLFVQPNIGYRSKHFEAAFSTRLAHLNYRIRKFDTNLNFMVFEPAITLRAGFGGVKLQLQAGLSSNTGKQYFPQEDLNISTGIFVDIW